MNNFALSFFLETGHETGAAQGFWIDGLEITMREINYPNLANQNLKMSSFYWIFPKIDGFENPSLKIEGFGRTPRTRANAAPAM